MDSEATSAVSALICAINSVDVALLCGLMTADHTFVDSRGKTVHGLDEMQQGWKKIFSMFPGYKVNVENMLQTVQVKF